MGVHGKALPACDAVVINHAKALKLHMLWIVIISETKAVRGFQPAMVSHAARISGAKRKAGSEFCRVSHIYVLSLEK